MSNELQPEVPAGSPDSSEMTPAEFLESEGFGSAEAERIRRFNDWKPTKNFPVDDLKAGVHRCLHGRI